VIAAIGRAAFARARRGPGARRRPGRGHRLRDPRHALIARAGCIAGDASSTHAGNERAARSRAAVALRPAPQALNADSPPAPSSPAPFPARATRRHATFAALLGLAGVGGPAMAQMGGPGGGGGGHGMRQQQDGPRQDKDVKDAHAPDASPPGDLMAAFARRLQEGVPELALAPPQQATFRDFVACLAEVGQHNERRLQRILWRSASTVSAVAPLKTWITAEVDEGEGRQEALVELKLAHDKFDAQIDERQRAVLGRLFVSTRSELQAPRER
jgi:hypothetical protein